MRTKMKCEKNHCLWTLFLTLELSYLCLTLGFSKVPWAATLIKFSFSTQTKSPSVSLRFRLGSCCEGKIILQKESYSRVFQMPLSFVRNWEANSWFLLENEGWTISQNTCNQELIKCQLICFFNFVNGIRARSAVHHKLKLVKNESDDLVS